jgi:hypothetical protein
MTTRTTATGPASTLACAMLALLTLAACNRGRQAASDTASDTVSDAVFPSQRATRAAPPKVPFGQQPCQSLTAADLAALNIEANAHSVSYRESPDSLPYDNACRWTIGGNELARVSYMPQSDYDATSQSMRSKQNVAPGDIPGAFYDQQGDLWFAKNGYFVEIGPTSRSREAVARRVAARL